MATHTLRQTFTLADTNWSNKTPADFLSMGGSAYSPAVTDVFTVVNIESVTTNDCSYCYGPRTGGADGGARGLISVPIPAEMPRYCTLTFGNLTITCIRDGEGDSGNKIDITGLTHAAFRTKIDTRVTAAATGVTNLVTTTGPTDNLIIMQSDAGETDSPVWSSEVDHLRNASGHGMVDAAAGVITAAGTMPPIKTLETEPTNIIALRANTANSVVTVEVEVRSSGAPVVL